MSQPSLQKHPPRGPVRWLLRTPLWLFRFRLGWLFGGRFIMLTHLGRKSGLPRQTVVEVARYDAEHDTFYVASGWGERADWWQNIQQTPRVLLDTGQRRVEAAATRLAVDAASAIFQDYAAKNPTAFRQLSRMMINEPLSASEEDCRKLARAVPLMELQVQR